MLVALQMLPAGSMSKSTKETSLWITAPQPLHDTCVSMEYIHSVLCYICHGNNSSLHCLQIILRFDLIERIFLFFIAQSISSFPPLKPSMSIVSQKEKNRK